MSIIHNLKEALKTKTGAQVAAIAGTLMTVFTMVPSLFETVMSVFPDGPMRVVIALLFGAFTFGVPTIAQMKDDQNAAT